MDYAMMDYANPPPIYSHLCHEYTRVQMADGTELIILDEIVLKQHGSYRQVRRYVKGKHPKLGPLIIGWSGGWETVWDVDVIRPMAVVTVLPEQQVA